MVKGKDGGWRPRLRPGVELAPAGGGDFQARWDFDEVAFLRGAACERILPWLVPLLDGKKTLLELTQAAAGKCIPAELEEVLASLEEHGLLKTTEPADDIDASLWNALQSLSPDPTAVIELLARTRIVVCGRSRVAELLSRSLAAQGFSWRGQAETARDLAESLFQNTGPTSIFPAVIETDWRPPELEAINNWCLARRRPWLLLGAWNRRVLVGPLFVPGETACYECYRRRLDSHRSHLAAYQALDSLRRADTRPAEPEPVLPATAESAAALASAEIFFFASGLRQAQTLGRVIVYHPGEARLETETLLRIPWCPACSQTRVPARGA